MFALATCIRATTCRRCGATIPAAVEHATDQHQDRAVPRTDRFCPDCAYTFIRPLVAEEILRLRTLASHIETAMPLGSAPSAAGRRPGR